MKCYNGIIIYALADCFHLYIYILSSHIKYLSTFSVILEMALGSTNNHSSIIARDDNLAKVMLRNVNNIMWLVKQVTC